MIYNYISISRIYTGKIKPKRSLNLNKAKNTNTYKKEAVWSAFLRISSADEKI